MSEEDRQNINDLNQEPAEAPKPPKTIKPRRAAKPLVEGINAPAVDAASKPSLGPADLKSGKDASRPGPRISIMKDIPPSWKGQKDRRQRGRLLPFIIALIIVAAAAAAYWQYGRNRGGSGLSEDQPGQNLLNQDQPAAPETATSTPSGENNSPATSTPAAPASIPPVLQIKVKPTPNGFLNVRSSPSLAGTVLTKIHPGETYIYTEEKPDWYKIQLPDSRTGWVNAQYVEVVK